MTKEYSSFFVHYEAKTVTDSYQSILLLCLFTHQRKQYWYKEFPTASFERYNVLNNNEKFQKMFALAHWSDACLIFIIWIFVYRYIGKREIFIAFLLSIVRWRIIGFFCSFKLNSSSSIFFLFYFNRKAIFHWSINAISNGIPRFLSK